jgi:hypothetical protein
MKARITKPLLGLAGLGASLGALALVVTPATAFAQPLAPPAPPKPGMPAPGPLFPQKMIATVAQTNAANGDTNPYGIAVVPKTIGSLTAGNVLVADFNNTSTMGEGTSIVQVNPKTGQTTTFFSSNAITGPVAIAINPNNDFVWLAYYGQASDGSQSGYAVISPEGTLPVNFTNKNSSYMGYHNLFEGVWGATYANGAFFWTNAGSSMPNSSGTTGQVWRLNPNPGGSSNGQPLNSTYTPLVTDLPTSDIAGTPPTPSTVAGPQGMAYDMRNSTLYVTDDDNNAIYAIPHALTATGPVTPVLVSEGGALMSPQGIVIDPINHNLLVVNGAGNNNLVEVTPKGRQVATRSLDQGGAGALFGIATYTQAGPGPMHRLGLYFDDSNTSTLDSLADPQPMPPMPPAGPVGNPPMPPAGPVGNPPMPPAAPMHYQS